MLAILPLVALLGALVPGSPARSIGPQDISTDYYINFVFQDVGQGKPVAVKAKLDSGGTTTLSQADAIRMGLVDANGCPPDPNQPTRYLGGTGGSGVKVYRFDNVRIGVRPRDADGNRAGDTRTIEVTVYVPAKESEQSGDAATRLRKVNSVITKGGANIAGGSYTGGGQTSKLGLKDEPGTTPTQNRRGTYWANVVPVPFHQLLLPFGPRGLKRRVPGITIEGTSVDAAYVGGPYTALPESLAAALRIEPVATVSLGFDDQASLLLAGMVDRLPEEDVDLLVSVGLASFIVTTSQGDFDVAQVACLIFPDADLPEPFIGINALVPESHGAVFADGEEAVLTVFSIEH